MEGYGTSGYLIVMLLSKEGIVTISHPADFLSERPPLAVFTCREKIEGSGGRNFPRDFTPLGILPNEGCLSKSENFEISDKYVHTFSAEK